MPTAGQAVADFMRYEGHPYVWGGWDCSGAINHVIGQDLGLAIPGYKARTYTGPPPHGPVVSDWLATDLCVTVPGPPKPGDLVIYGPDTHIGMAVSATRYLSALDPTLGTQISPISTGPGAPTYRRVKAFGLGGVIPAMPKHARAPAAGSVVLRLLLLGGVAVGAVGAVVVGVAVLTSGGGAAGAGLLARRRTSADY
jgi:hypothetical protein